MRFLRIVTVFSIAAIALGILSVFPLKEMLTEVNQATGAMRSRDTYFWAFRKSWKETPTWISLRAAELGVNTGTEWQFLGERTYRLTSMTRGCGRAPEAYWVRVCDDSGLEPEQRDRFVLAFTKASEPERKEMIRKLTDGEAIFP